MLLIDCLLTASLRAMTDSTTIAQGQGREVRISSSDGFKLSGVFHAAKSSGPGVLLLHQCDREGMLTGYERLAELLSDCGFHVLTIDYKGQGHGTPLFAQDGNLEATIADWFHAHLIGKH